MLIVNNVEVRYREIILVLRGVSLEVPHLQIVSLLGANGAGKTTLLKAISGILFPEEGRVSEGFIEFEGIKLSHLNFYDIAKAGIIHIAEGRKIFPHLTVEENLLLGAHLRKDSSSIKNDLDMTYEYYPRLQELTNQVAGYLSGGEQQMLVLGRGLMARPRLLLLDEPTNGLSPTLVKELFESIQRMNKELEVSILLVEQNAMAALKIAHYGYALENGKIVLDGTPDKLYKSADLREFYLGLTEAGKRKNYREVKHYKRRKRWLA